MSVVDAGDPFDLDDDNPPAADDKSQKDAEARANRLEAQNRKQQKELEDLRAKWGKIEAEQRKAEVSQALTEAGLPGGTAAAWLAMHPDQEITEETVSAFAETLGLTPKASSQSSEQVPKPQQPAGSTPEVTWHNPQTTGSTLIPPQKMTFRELDAKMRTNQAAAREDIKEGRVDLDVVQVGPGTWEAKPKGT